MDLQRGDQILVCGQPMTVEGIKKRWNIICATDKWGGLHQLVLSDITRVERRSRCLVPSQEWEDIKANFSKTASERLVRGYKNVFRI